jgi:hypothetical protein
MDPADHREIRPAEAPATSKYRWVVPIMKMQLPQ